MEGRGWTTIGDRMVAVARLDIATIEEIERDATATGPALVVVLMGVMAGGVGSAARGAEAVIGGLLAQVLLWVVFSGVAYYVGTRILATSATSSSWREVMRTLGFAYTPLLLTAFGGLPGIGPVLAFAGLVWFLMAATIALRQALDFTTNRAIGTALIAFAPSVAVAGTILGLFGFGG